MNFSIIILAAGLGKRMNNPDVPKVLAKLNGFPMIYYVLRTAISLKPDKICIVVGHHREKLISYIENDFLKKHPSINIKYVPQEEQLGTGHAVKCCADSFKNYTGKILILPGDVPLLSANTLMEFIEDSIESDLSVLTSITPNPFGYGRILRDNDEHIIGIREEKDASDWEKLINEINTGIYFVYANLLFSLLDNVKNTNSQSEYYLTDIVSIGLEKRKQVFAGTIAPLVETQGVNTFEQLEILEKIMLKL
jgi:bifunctional UDP-N-acetylglucosamine pyrophosphorylase/glucosamine-1-phosphate N-acetyltransferase